MVALVVISLLILVVSCDEKSGIRINQQEKRDAIASRVTSESRAPSSLSSWKHCFDNATTIVGGTDEVVVVRLGVHEYSGPSTILSIDAATGDILGRLDISSVNLFFGVAPGGFNPVFLLYDSTNVTAWSLPDLLPAWFTETGPISMVRNYYSRTHSLFCTFVFVNGLYAYPVCYCTVDGSLLWSAENTSFSPFNGECELSEDVFLCSLTNNHFWVYAFNATTGQVLWDSYTLLLSGVIWMGIDGILLLSTGGWSGMAAVDMFTGRPLWNNSAVQALIAPSLGAPGPGVFVANTTGYNVSTGESLWTIPALPDCIVLPLNGVPLISAGDKILCYSSTPVILQYNYTIWSAVTGEVVSQGPPEYVQQAVGAGSHFFVLESGCFTKL